MVGMKKYLLFCIFVAMFVSIAFADFSVNVTPNVLEVEKGSQGVFNILITTDEAGRFSITIDGWKTWFTLENYAPNVLNSKTVKLYISPGKDVDAKVYQIKINVETAGEEKKTIERLIKVKNKYDVTIDTIKVEGEAKPLGTIKLIFGVKNEGTIPLKNLKLFSKVYGKTTLSSFEYKIDELKAGEEKIFEKEISLPENIYAGAYIVAATLSKGLVGIEEKRTSFTVEALPIVKIEKEQTRLLFGLNKKIIVKNYGNEEAKNIRVTEPIHGISKDFYFGDGQIEGNEVIWVINTLAPGEEKILNYQINYFGLIALIIVFIFLIWFYFNRIKILKIRKFIMQKKSIRLGAEFTVGLEIKNDSGAVASGVIIEDFVPSIFSLVVEKGPKPVVKKQEAGARLVWKLRKFEPGEIRLLSYKLKSVVGVEGEIKLPRASISHKKAGHSLKTYSSRPKIGL